jgi:hypothetical protein
MKDTSETRNRSERRAAASAAHGGGQKFGWKVTEWSNAVGCSRSRTYELIAEQRIDSIKLGSSRLIVTHPADFLASLKGAA